MLSERYKILLVPVQVSEFIYDSRLTKSLAIFLYLKMFAGDKVSAKDDVFAKLRQDLKMTDAKGRTFCKHFQKLLELNWIGYNPNSGIYHIRSFDWIRAVNGFKKRSATKIFLKDIQQLQVYLVGVLLCSEVRAQKFYFEKVKGRPRTATKKREVAKQFKASHRSFNPLYYGLSNKRIARLLGCKYTNACKLKHAAADSAYVTIHHRYIDFKELKKADELLRPTLAEWWPEVAKRIRFWSRVRNGNKIVKVVMQLHDEITPHIEFKRIAKFTALKVPMGIIKKLSRSPRKAA